MGKIDRNALTFCQCSSPPSIDLKSFQLFILRLFSLLVFLLLVLMVLELQHR